MVAPQCIWAVAGGAFLGDLLLGVPSKYFLPLQSMQAYHFDITTLEVQFQLRTPLDHTGHLPMKLENIVEVFGNNGFCSFDPQQTRFEQLLCSYHK